ncbi:hypothetical protein Tco_0144351 [Tanacetum coccineum]
MLQAPYLPQVHIATPPFCQSVQEINVYMLPTYLSTQVNMFPHAFHTMTPQDPAWNMDIGASSHLADNIGGILGEVGVTTFRNAIGANYLAYSTEYAEVPSLKTVRAWFSTIGYSGEIGGKTGGFDQISNKYVIILYCLANGVDIDYARLIQEDIINKLNKNTREKAVPYHRFLSLLLKQKMEGYENDNVTLNPTQIFSVHNWELKKNQPEGPPFTPSPPFSSLMLAICNADEPVAFKAPITSSKAEKKVSQGTKPGAKSERKKKQILVLYNHP